MEKEFTKESIFIIGKVVSVDGRIVKVRVNKDKNRSHVIFEGKTVKNVSVGSYVKIVKGFINIIGKVEGEKISEEKYFNREYNKEETKINRELQISLFGHFDDNDFKQGIKEMPLIDNECYLLNRDEFNVLHKFYKSGSKTIAIGNLTEEPSQRIKLSINKLFASHIGIFGNTGSGKSNTLAKIYTELFVQCQEDRDFNSKSKYLVIDFNGEYAGDAIITKNKDLYKLSTGKRQGDKFPISKENIKKLEILSVLLEATEKTQKPFLNRALRDKYFSNVQNYGSEIVSRIKSIFNEIIKKADWELGLGVFTDIFNDLSSLIVDESKIQTILNSITEKLTWHGVKSCYVYTDNNSQCYSNNDPESKLINWLYDLIKDLQFKDDEFSKLKMMIILNYYFETIKGFSNQEHIGPLKGRMFKKLSMLEKLISIEDSNSSDSGNSRQNIIIVSLKEVNIEMKKVIPLIICKQLYDEKKEDADRQKSLHIIIDEAHNILSTMSQRESEIWKDYRLETFEEIIKEGRKFGTFLTIASQRPYDISPTIISQLHNYFIHRLINNNDIQAIEKTVAYLDKLSFQTIPILSVGSCFVAGLASDIPIKVDVDLLDAKQRPISETVDLERAWNPTSGNNSK